MLSLHLAACILLQAEAPEAYRISAYDSDCDTRQTLDMTNRSSVDVQAGRQFDSLLLLFFMLAKLVAAHTLLIAKVMRKSDFDFSR